MENTGVKIKSQDVFKVIGEICRRYDIELYEITIEGNDVVIAFRIRP